MQETSQLQADVLKLSRKLAGGDPSKLKDGEIMREVLMTSERMAAEKNKVGPMNSSSEGTNIVEGGLVAVGSALASS